MLCVHSRLPVDNHVKCKEPETSVKTARKKEESLKPHIFTINFTSLLVFIYWLVPFPHTKYTSVSRLALAIYLFIAEISCHFIAKQLSSSKTLILFMDNHYIIFVYFQSVVADSSIYNRIYIV